MVGVMPSTVRNTSQKYFDSLNPVREATWEILRFVSCKSSFADSNRTRVISLFRDRPNSALILRSRRAWRMFRLRQYVADLNALASVFANKPQGLRNFDVVDREHVRRLAADETLREIR